MQNRQTSLKYVLFFLFVTSSSDSFSNPISKFIQRCFAKASYSKAIKDSGAPSFNPFIVGDEVNFEVFGASFNAKVTKKIGSDVRVETERSYSFEDVLQYLDEETTVYINHADAITFTSYIIKKDENQKIYFKPKKHYGKFTMEELLALKEPEVTIPSNRDGSDLDLKILRGEGEEIYFIGDKVSIRARKITDSPLPTQKEFSNKYPYDLNNPTEDQTYIVDTYGNRHRVMGYDPLTGKVKLARTEIGYSHGRQYYSVVGQEDVKVSDLKLNSNISLKDKNGDWIDWEIDSISEDKSQIRLRRFKKDWNRYRSNSAYSNQNGYWVYETVEVKRDNYYTWGDFEKVNREDIKLGNVVTDDYGYDYEIINIDSNSNALIYSRQVVSEVDYNDVENLLENESFQTSPRKIMDQIKKNESWKSLFQRSRVKTLGKDRVKLVKTTDGKVSYELSGEKTGSRDLFREISRSKRNPDILKIERQEKADGKYREIYSNFEEHDLLHNTESIKITYKDGTEKILKKNGYKDVERYRLSIWYDRVAIFNEATPRPSKIYEFDLLGSKVKVVIPSMDESLQMKFLEKAKSLLAMTPQKFPDANERIIFDTTGDYYFESFRGTTVKAAATASRNGGDGTIREVQFYAPSLQGPFVRGLKKVFWHETAHTIAYKLWGNAVPKDVWEEAMSVDKAFISTYSKTNLAEDFAEVVEAYIASDGGYYAPRLRQKFRHRFEILDRIFAD